MEAQEQRRQERAASTRTAWGPWRSGARRCRTVTVLGFSDWLAWHESDNATTPEDIENMGTAVQAVKRGFADMEAQVKGKSDDTSG